VVAAAGEDGAAVPGVLAAPGRSILTLAPGGGYDYASGSSLATAHVSGAVALLRSVDGTLDGAAAHRLLSQPSSAIDACRALQRLDARVPAACAASR
jgi:subtilisin family serine protease